jgi:hypothetical protein
MFVNGHSQKSTNLNSTKKKEGENAKACLKNAAWIQTKKLTPNRKDKSYFEVLGPTHKKETQVVLLSGNRRGRETWSTYAQGLS